MLCAQRRIALDRTYTLFERDTRLCGEKEPAWGESPPDMLSRRGIRRYLSQANLSLSPLGLCVLSLLGGTVCSWLFGEILSLYFLPIFFLVGALLPFAWCERRISKRANEFAAEYPTVLLATASSLKAGMTALTALERSIRLLPKTSLVRSEIETLLSRLIRGVPREKALQQFASTIRQPDLDLFRSAFLLVLENGGRFAPTLERLAGVCQDRSMLVRTAQVTTSTMRMTANVLLIMIPLIMSMIAVRTEDFWSVFVNHPVANTVASIGIMIIGISLAVLTKMSSFKP